MPKRAALLEVQRKEIRKRKRKELKVHREEKKRERWEGERKIFDTSTVPLR